MENKETENYEDFSKYMNEPECPVSVGDICIKGDSLFEEECKVISVFKKVVKNNKGESYWTWYACVKSVDSFSGDEVREEVNAYTLKKK